ADNADKFDEDQSASLIAVENFGIVTNIVTGPGGNLYVTSLSNGAVYMIANNSLGPSRSRPANVAQSADQQTGALSANGTTESALAQLGPSATASLAQKTIDNRTMTAFGDVPNTRSFTVSN